MMYGNYGFDFPSPYEGQPCDKPLGIGPRVKEGLIASANYGLLFSLFAPYYSIPTFFFITPLLSKVVLKDASYTERLLKGNAALFALAAVYMSFDGAKRFKKGCKRKAKRDAEKALFDERRQWLMGSGYPEKRAKEAALLSMGYKKTDSWRFV